MMKRNSYSKFKTYFALIVLAATLLNCAPKQDEKTVKEVMDKTISDLYKTMTKEQLTNLKYDDVMKQFTKEELQVLATKHWMFTANVPVIVSVMRSTEQETVPFWLPESGFKRTDLKMNNEKVTYEVWQKPFDFGPIGLGINGIENYSLHYFVSVAPQNSNDKLVLSDFFPENQYVGILEDSSFVYHDWDELVLRHVPEALKGQQYLTTIRGRGTETHILGAFRSTLFPSSKTPDQILLTWSSDASTGIDIQWRTDTTVTSGEVKYREKGTNQELTATAEKYRMEDRVLMNDRYINRFTAELRNLKPGTTYEYQIVPQTDWTDNQTFSTAALDNSFSFIWLGDTHFSKDYGDIINKAEMDHPDAAFYSVAGDMISDGLHRDQWDQFFDFPKDIISRKPMMNVLGNHDNRSGLGALMYRELFSYPKNGPVGIPEEHTYAFRNKNALFLMIDATSPIEAQSQWIEDQLKNTDATWKFAMFHFPPYNWEEPYFNIQKAWVPIFDKYHVDMVMGGHIHYYMRSKPMKDGKVVSSYNDGTAYVISIGLATHYDHLSDEPYAEKRDLKGQLYQYMKIDGNKMTFEAVNFQNQVIDSFNVTK